MKSPFPDKPVIASSESANEGINDQGEILVYDKDTFNSPQRDVPASHSPVKALWDRLWRQDGGLALSTSIPQQLHYVWLGGGVKSHLVNLCILSWKDKMPGYQIIEWNESNFPFEAEFRKCSFLEECYKRQLWAFVSDYMRVHVLFHSGGIYLDTDMYLTRSTAALHDNPVFIGFEREQKVNLAIAGSVSHHPLWDKVLQFYRKEIWCSDLYTVPDIITTVLQRDYGLELNGKLQVLHDSVHVYSREYFYPYYYNEEFTPECIKSDTYGIHWWSSSWKSKEAKVFLRTKHLRGWRKCLKYLSLKIRF